MTIVMFWAVANTWCDLGPDIYGHDSYPIGWDCAHPANWTPGNLPTNWRELHLEQSPNTPYAIPEFQGGAIDGW